MAKKKSKCNHRTWKFLGLGILIAILLISSYVLSVFLDVLLLSIAVSYVVYPLAKWINKKINGNLEKRSMKYVLASLASVLLVAIPIIFILFFGLNMVLNWFVQNFTSISSGNFSAELQATLNSLGLGIVSSRLASEAGKLVSGFADSISALVLRPTWLVETFIKVGVFFTGTFYFVYEGPRIKNLLKDHIPAREKFINELITSVDRILYGLFVGHFFTSIIIGIIAGFGFWLILRPSLFMLGFLTALMFVISFLPVIGPWFMYVPMALGVMAFTPNGMFKGVALLVYGLIFLTAVPEFYIRPKIVERGSEIHPLLLILGFFGGPILMGLKGIVIGPLILGLAQAMFGLYIKKRHILKELIEHF
ncbi:MAG: AI-2E family transporter [Candidatus Undinarchaeales archaeon]